MSLAVDEEGNYSYCGPTIKDGRLFIVFNENYVWTNVNDSLDGLLKVIDAADAASGSAGALSATVRSCIAQDFDPKIGDIQNDIRAILKNDAVTLNPNWEQVATDLASAGSKATDDWQTRVGFLALDYFDAAVRRLKEQNFDSDDMLQEAFAEAVSKNEIALRVVDTLKDSSKSYFQAIVEDGVLYIDILPDCFGTNSAYALENLDTILDAAL
jgi:hypothetical protein